MTNSRGSLFGRITALAVILAAAYGVNAVAHGKYGIGCGVSCGGCCFSSDSTKTAPAPVPADNDD